MKRIALILICLTVCLASARQFGPLEERFDLAHQAWDGGDYIKALQEFEAILLGPEGGRFFDRIALLTGELYQTSEIATDGRSGRFNPTGRFIAHEAGPRAAPVTRILAADNPGKTLVEVRGSSLAFSPTADSAAYIKMKATPELASLRKELAALLAQPSPGRQALVDKQRQLAWLEAKNGEIILFDIAAKKEKILKTEGLLKSALVFSADGREVYFLGAKATEPTSSDIYAVSETGVPRALTAGSGFKTSPMVVLGGKYLIYTITDQNPFPRPLQSGKAAEPGKAAAPATGVPAGQSGATGQIQSAGSGALQANQSAASQGQRNAPPPNLQFAVLNLVDGKTEIFSGSSPSVSADGSALVFLRQEGNETSLQFLKLGEALSPVTLKKTSERIGSAALAPDGSGVVFDMTYTRNGEIFFLKSDGRGEVRLSREIQPDRAPRFLNSNLVLAVKGESRHSRAYIYDLTELTATRIFHNNTLRTIAPEYEWAADPDGVRLLIQAERDGDTVSAERGLYLIDLARKITRDTLLARLRANLRAEQALRVKGEEMFAPLAARVKAVTENISITKIYEYEEKLFSFDSKHISQPGNQWAADYIFQMFKSFGFQPEFQPFIARDIKTANILAVLPGTENPALIYVLSSHFDSNERGPGADDNSSATAVLLETARVLARSPLASTVVFAAFTGEEAGLLGSREFVRQAVEKKWRIMADLNNDMIGWANDHRLDNTIRYTNAGIRDIQHSSSFLFSKLITYDARYVKSTDAQAFWDAYGDVVGGFGSYPVLGSPYYHQPTDLLENVNHRLVEETAKATTASIMMLASSPSPVKGLAATAAQDGTIEVTWTPNPEKNIVSYLVQYGRENSLRAGSLTVNESRAVIPGPKLTKGERLPISVKAVNPLGVQSWDWARVFVAVSGK